MAAIAIRGLAKQVRVVYTVSIRFYEELNDFIPKAMRKRDTECEFPNRRSVKDLVESLGVPHTEVDLILVNGQSVDFSHIVKHGDRISVYPVFETLPVRNVTRLRPLPLRDPKFLCDVHLGKLARRLRLLGLDVRFDPHAEDAELIETARAEGRILLTRDRRLLMHNAVTRGIFVQHNDADAQTKELLDRLDLREECKPFTRCTVCNGRLRALTEDETRSGPMRDRIPERILQACTTFTVCLDCGRVYWKGSHYDKLDAVVHDLLDSDEAARH